MKKILRPPGYLTIQSKSTFAHRATWNMNLLSARPTGTHQKNSRNPSPGVFVQETLVDFWAAKVTRVGTERNIKIITLEKFYPGLFPRLMTSKILHVSFQSLFDSKR